MKKILLIILLLSVIHSFSQEKTIINLGAGLPIFFQHNFRAPQYGPYYMSLNRIHLIAEKPFSLGEDRKFSINPGIVYFVFNESAESGGLGAHSYKNANHKAIGFSGRFFYQFRIKQKSRNIYYCGLTGGKYIYSKSNGNSSWYRLEESKYIGGNSVIDNNGKAFFHSFYYGFTSGFTGLTKENARFAPAFEFSYYPEFMTLNDKKWPMALFSVILKINSKETDETISK